MPQIVLDTVDYDQKIVERVSSLLSKFFRDEIYIPLMSDLKQSGFGKIENSSYSLLKALQEGRISFYRGHFKGRFNARISKDLKSIGAKWDRKHGSFRLPSSKLPKQIKTAVETSYSTWVKKTELIKKKLDKLDVDDMVKKIDFTKLVDKSLYRLDGDMQKSLEGIVVSPELTDENRRHIAENYTENMQLYIKDWTENEIVSLREKVEKNVMSGIRYEALSKDIEKSYGVSKSKALFLARQETKLMVSKFKESRYNEAGIHSYIWTTVVGSKDSPVRESHKKLNGMKFRFDDPPVVNAKGEKKNPSEDYGCRCTARAVLEF